MNRTLIAAVAVTAFSTSLFASARAESPLEGRWTGTSGENDDIPVTLTVKGNSLLLEIRLPSGHAFPIRGEFSLDAPAKPPATLEIRKMKGPDDEPIPDIKGIVLVEGDTVKMCLSDPGGPRPADVDKTPETGGSRMTLKRAPKK
jgi:uncharacterized protein (TIGR03067 family)